MKKQLEILRRYEAALAGLEDKARPVFQDSLSSAFRKLENELRQKYDKLLSEADILQSQRQLLIAQELGELLQIVDPRINYEVTLQNLIENATVAGAYMAGELIQATEPGAAIAAFAGVNVEAVAFAANNAFKRLSGYGDEFATRAGGIIAEAIAQGWGVGKIVPLLRQQLGVTKVKAEMLARTETISALSGAAQQRYKDNGINYVQWIVVRTACPLCMARNGNVYELGKVMHPGHPGDRCVLIPYKPEWQKLGLTDDAAASAYRQAVIDASDKPPKNDLMPFEKAAGWTKVPVPFWKA